MKEQEKYWLAGLLEGEGHFGLSQTRHRPTINLSMTDEDVVQRACEIVGVGSVRPENRNDGNKPVFTWRIGAREPVVALCEELLPLMGERRAKAIQAILDWDQEYPRQRARKGDIPHGIRSRYARGCRCNLCKAAETAYQKDIRIRRNTNEVGTKGVARYPFAVRLQERNDSSD